jgi:HEAT repeat protein
VTAPGPVARAAEFASLAHDAPLTRDEIDHAVEAGRDDDARVRAAALAALVRGAAIGEWIGAWRDAIADDAPAVRRRAAELAPLAFDPAHDQAPVDELEALLADPDVTVVEATAWAFGELENDRAVDALSAVVIDHDDPIAREAAVAALGAIGDARGLPAILHATRDKPAVRRRAVLALAPFDGPDVDAAITAALDDRDWQVRQAAEDLSS